MAVETKESEEEIKENFQEKQKLDPIIEVTVKNHLNIIILSMLSKGPMCGYDMIKEIFGKYNVLISQGTVYPLLYSLKEEGIVQAGFMKGNMRTKMYSVTPKGEQIIKKKMGEFVKAEVYILNSIKNEEYEELHV